MSNRILDTVTGRESAIKEIESYANCFNDLNGLNRMIITGTELEAWDQEGSGEFVIAVCLNTNETESCATEIYQIQTCW